MKRPQLAGQLSCRGDVLAISKFGLAAKVKTVYGTFARIMTDVIVLAFVDLSHLLTFKFEPTEFKQQKKLSYMCMKLYICIVGLFRGLFKTISLILSQGRDIVLIRMRPPGLPPDVASPGEVGA